MFYTDLTPFGVDLERLTAERLRRLQETMKQHGLTALLLTDFLNIRYATNTVFMLGLRATAFQRVVLVPAEGFRLVCWRETARNCGTLRRFAAYMFAVRLAAATKNFCAQVTETPP